MTVKVKDRPLVAVAGAETIKCVAGAATAAEGAKIFAQTKIAMQSASQPFLKIVKWTSPAQVSIKINESLKEPVWRAIAAEPAAAEESAP